MAIIYFILSITAVAMGTRFANNWKITGDDKSYDHALFYAGVGSGLMVAVILLFVKWIIGYG